MRLATISTYPVKGGYRLEHASATVEPWGLAGDRRWLVVQPDGRFLSQREVPLLTQLRPVPRPGGGLVLRSQGLPDLDVPTPAGGDHVPVVIWRDEVAAAPAGAHADEWLSRLLDRTVRLVYLDDARQRPVKPAYARPDDRVSFADAYPLLLTNTASLDALNDHLLVSGSVEAPLPMNRFRPNVVVSAAPAWAEDGWLGGVVRIGAVTFRVAAPCARCLVTTTDQETGARGHEPLRVLAKHRLFDQELLFGVNLIPDGTGEIAVGDPVTVA